MAATPAERLTVEASDDLKEHAHERSAHRHRYQ
jgi:hypothetical protein